MTLNFDDFAKSNKKNLSKEKSKSSQKKISSADSKIISEMVKLTLVFGKNVIKVVKK